MSASGTSVERRTSDFVPAGHRLRPLRDRLIVRALEWKPSTVIELAGNARKTLRGVVIAAGPGTYPWRYNHDRSKRRESRHFQRTEVNVGDVVELGGLENGGYDFPTITLNGALHVICQEQDICGVDDAATNQAHHGP